MEFWSDGLARRCVLIFHLANLSLMDSKRLDVIRWRVI